MPGPVVTALLDALAVLAPIECAGCGADDRGLCDACIAQLAASVEVRGGPEGVPLYTALLYEGVVRGVILAFKESGRTDVARALAVPLRAAVGRAMGEGSISRGNGATDPVVVAMPTSGTAWRRRGYDPVRMVCRRAGIRTSRLLVRRGVGRTQKSLAASERVTNLRGAMSARRGLTGVRVVLVDDVVTTGATVAEAIRAVRFAGGEVVAVAAVAYTQRRREAGSGTARELSVTLPDNGATVGTQGA